MRIVGVGSPGSGELLRLDVAHGQHPQLSLWRDGYVISTFLSAHLDDEEIVLTARLARRTRGSKPPRIKRRGKDLRLKVATGETAVLNQRVASYAVVRSPRGVLGTECSNRTAVPGLWQLPGGGVQQGESPAEAVVREVHEESGQQIRLNKLLDLQSDHWVGRAPNGVLEDFHALRIFYSATCTHPTSAEVLDVAGTTERADWVPLRQWRSLPWTSGSRSVLDRHLADVPVR